MAGKIVPDHGNSTGGTAQGAVGASGATGSSTGGGGAVGAVGNGGAGGGTGGTANAGNGTGAQGGAGGTITVNAGTFDMSNTMSATAQSAAGIMVISQNTGIAALTQQSVNVQANLNVGRQ